LKVFNAELQAIHHLQPQAEKHLQHRQSNL